MINLPEPFEPQGKHIELKRIVCDLLEFVRENVKPSTVPVKAATWSQSSPVSTEEHPIGEMRPVEGSPTICEVWDGYGWMRMTNDYYEAKYKGCSQPVSPPVAEEEVQ